ncbi:MAG: hypothetical protein ACREVR_13640, partial [Burkholderiales bacterium]
MSGPKERPGDPLTRAGVALYAFVFLAPVVALGWLYFADPFGWFGGIRINKASAIVLVIAAPVILILLLLVSFLLYAVLSTVLEALGVQLTRPAAPGSIRPG